MGTSDKLLEIAAKMGVKAAILAVDRPTPRLVRTVLEARLAGMEIIGLPDIYEQFGGRVPVNHAMDQWLLSSDGFHLLSQEYIQKIKRVLDCVVSGLLLVLFAPLMLLTALAIRLESPGPVFYRQERVGMGGKVFRVFKFRSMRQDAEKKGGSVGP